MTSIEIINYNPINETESNHVAELKASIMENGWQGAPILVCMAHNMLITGSHRLAALKDIYDNELDFDLDSLGDVAESVDEILDAWCEENGCIIDDIPVDCLSLVFAGTWVEEYKDDIIEW